MKREAGFIRGLGSCIIISIEFSFRVKEAECSSSMSEDKTSVSVEIKECWLGFMDRTGAAIARLGTRALKTYKVLGK